MRFHLPILGGGHKNTTGDIRFIRHVLSPCREETSTDMRSRFRDGISSLLQDSKNARIFQKSPYLYR
jgi:hypothetical protein